MSGYIGHAGVVGRSTGRLDGVSARKNVGVPLDLILSDRTISDEEHESGELTSVLSVYGFLRPALQLAPALIRARMPSLIPIHSNWSFTQVGQRGNESVTAKDEWLPTSTFPTSVHVELIKLGKIPDPYIGLNEWDVQWVGEADWQFRTSFSLQAKQISDPYADIVFDGLDTYCTNGKAILEANNMFLPYRITVKEHLVEGTNELVLTFPSTFVKGKYPAILIADSFSQRVCEPGRELQEKHGKFSLWNGDSSRLHVRTAQYTYGWDWGPVLRTIGPWRPITLETYTVRLSDVRVRQDVKEDLSAELSVDIEVSEKSSGLTSSIVLKSSAGSVVKSADVKIKDGRALAAFKLAKEEIDLWYPVGYGKPALYTVDVQVADESGKEVAAHSQRIGIRRARVVQEPLEGQEGRSNWIPADNFLTNITAERYRAWLQLLVDGNQNMVRIWAGGIYEDDVFYDTCDELGILVWQDFMFGCGQYPAYDSLVESVKLEAEANVKRMRHHPSLVIWAGNNEDYQVAESLKLELDYDADPNKVDFRKTNFPARHIYEVVLPEVVGRLSETHYHRASPYSGYGKPTTDRTYGDIHQWNVWHGSQEPWHNWDILSGRFVSEFGMEGFPDIRTVDYWLGGNKAERHPQSRIMNNHNKADGFERRLELYLVENFKHAFDIESYVYYTQIMQAETLASAYRLWRREWRGKGKEYTAGALVWQINDCWPVTSWAIVDYFLRPKPAYFTIARELRPYTVGMTRKTIKKPLSPTSALYASIETHIELWGTNSTLEPAQVTLEIRSFDIENGGKLIDTQKLNVTLAPNSSTELWKGVLPGEGKRTRDSDPHNVVVVQARLLSTDGKVLARYSNWPEPFKFIHFPTPEQVGLKISTSKGEGSDDTLVMLSSSIPIKGIILDVDGEEVKWSDQAIDLAPGDDQVVVAKGLKGRQVKARYLGDGTA